PHAATPTASAAASTTPARPRACLPSIAASSRPVRASPPPLLARIVADSHSRPPARVPPMGICPPACHDTVVGGLRRAIAAVHAGDLSPTATRGRLGLVPLAAVGIAFGFASFLQARSAPGWSFAGTSALAAVAAPAGGWSLSAAGVVEARRRRARRAGLLLAAAGIGWFLVEWNNPGVGSPAAFTFGLIVYGLAAPLVAHAALAYPKGRLDSRLDAGVLLLAYAGAGLVLGLLPGVFSDPGRQGCARAPANRGPLAPEPSPVRT